MMQWIFLTLSIALHVLSTILITVSATSTLVFKEELNNRWKVTLSLVGLLGAGLAYYLLSIAIQDLSIITVFGMWGGTGALSSAVVLLLFYPQTWTWSRNFFLVLIGVGMFGLLFTN